MVYVARQEFEMFEGHKFAKEKDLANLEEYLPMRKKMSVEADLANRGSGLPNIFLCPTHFGLSSFKILSLWAELNGSLGLCRPRWCLLHETEFIVLSF